MSLLIKVRNLLDKILKKPLSYLQMSFSKLQDYPKFRIIFRKKTKIKNHSKFKCYNHIKILLKKQMTLH